MLQRLDLRSARFDRLSECVEFKGRGITLAVTLDTLEASANRELTPEEAVLEAVDIERRLARLGEILPADDGRVLVTRERLLNDGRFAVGEADAKDTGQDRNRRKGENPSCRST